jgi:hypothetical protein
MTLIGRKFENLLPYHTLHCGSEVIGFSAIFKWSYRSAVVDHADIVVLLLLLIKSRMEEKEATTPMKIIRLEHQSEYYRLECIYSLREIID